MDTPCIIATGTVVAGGYINLWIPSTTPGVRGRSVRAHRYAWEQAKGPIPDGLNVCHHCDNPPCRNVEHLFLGTAKDNVHDAIAKGRMKPLPLRAVCRRGHPYTVRSSGTRVCDICRRAAEKNSERILARARAAVKAKQAQTKRERTYLQQLRWGA